MDIISFILGRKNGRDSVKMQEKTVTPGESEITVTPDTGYDALSQVIVEAVEAVEAGGGEVKYKSAYFKPTSASSGYRVSIDFGFKPDILIVCTADKETSGAGFFGGFGISSRLAEAIGRTSGVGFEQDSNASTVSYSSGAALIDTTASLYSEPFNHADETGFNLGYSPMSTSCYYYVYAIGWLA
ncbi:MAG: hypothetical protein J6V25_07980 [Oscillospiraceae bacterium]|nr:hypothetical protein [Oscillospiraceae bacterium]